MIERRFYLPVFALFLGAVFLAASPAQAGDRNAGWSGGSCYGSHHHEPTPYELGFDAGFEKGRWAGKRAALSGHSACVKHVPYPRHGCKRFRSGFKNGYRQAYMAAYRRYTCNAWRGSRFSRSWRRW
ncbi:MAG: hypothetical protein ACYTGR_12870 [Planctomycetota bacterium]